MRLICLLFSLLLFQVSLFAQKTSYMAGTIILKDGTTINGEIKRTGKQLHESIKFRSSESGEIRTYSPNELKGFSFSNGETFQTLRVGVEEINNLRLFVQVLVKGAVELYYLKYSVADDPSPFYSLENEFFYVKKKEINEVLPLRRGDFKVWFLEYFNECSKMKNEIGKYKYQSEDLVQMVKDYNTCINSPSVIFYKKPQGRKKANFLLGGGFLLSDIKPGIGLLKDKENTPGLGMTLEGIIELPLKYGLSINGGISYIARKSNWLHEEIVPEPFTNAGETISATSFYTLRHVGCPVGLKFKIGRKTIRPYINAGGIFRTRLKHTYRVHKVDVPPNGIKRYGDYTYSATIAVYDLSYFVQGGVELHLKNGLRFYVEPFYTKGKNDAPDDSLLFFKYQSYGIKLGYII